jgi:hypothetical protein
MTENLAASAATKIEIGVISDIDKSISIAVCMIMKLKLIVIRK